LTNHFPFFKGDASVMKHYKERLEQQGQEDKFLPS